MLDIELTESEFIEQAYRFAIECCDCLKWIYAYSYFVTFPNEFKKENFEFSQGEFEKYKESLLKKLSFDLKQFLADLEKKVKLEKPLNKA